MPLDIHIFILFWIIMQETKSARHNSKRQKNTISKYANSILKEQNGLREMNSMEESYVESQVNSQDQPQFQTKNYFFELQSKYNNLDYEKTKKLLQYQNQISELKHKNAYLQNCASKMSQDIQVTLDEREQLRFVLGEVRQQNHSLSKQIYKVRQQLLGLQTRSVRLQVQPNQHLIQQLEQKKHEIDQKNHRIEELKSEVNQYKIKKSQQASKHSQDLLARLNRLQNEKKELQQKLRGKHSQQKILRQENERRQKKLKEQKQILSDKLLQRQQKLQQQIFKCRLEMDNLREQNDLKQRKSSLLHNEQIRHLKQQKSTTNQSQKEYEEQKTMLLNKMNELTLQMNKLKSNKNNLEEYIKYLEESYNKDEVKCKKMQEEIYGLEKECCELKDQLFNQRLASKKIINDCKIQYQEEKIKYSQIIEEKNKEAFKFKELSLSSNRQNLDFQEVNQKCLKVSEQLQQNKRENDQLKQQIRNLRQKYDKKSEKLSSLQKQLKKDYQDRIKQLESQLYKMQILNSQFQIRLEYQNKGKTNKSKEQMFGFNNQDEQDNNDNNYERELVELLKMQKVQKEEQLKDIRIKLKQKEQLYSHQQQKINRLQGELRQAKDFQYRNSVTKEDTSKRLKAINELEEQNMRLNKEIKKQRSTNQQQKKMLSQVESKLKDSQRKLQEQIGHFQLEYNNLKKQYMQIVQRCQYLQAELNKLESIINEKDQMNKECLQIREQLQNRFNKENMTLVNRIQLLEKTIIDLKTHIDSQNASQRSSSNAFLEQLQKDNYQLKLDYSDSLQEINSLLIKYQRLEEKHKKLSSERNNPMKQDRKEIGRQSKNERELREIIQTKDDQLHKLNLILMEKQKQIRMLKNHNSYHKNQQKKNINTQLWLSTSGSPRLYPNYLNNVHFPTEQSSSNSYYYKK